MKAFTTLGSTILVRTLVVVRTILVPTIFVATMLVTSCATADERVSVDDAKSTADVDALEKIQMCTSTVDDARAALGEPYRDGVANRLHIVAWKVRPGGNRESEPVVIAFRSDGVAVDICYDIPGMVKCDLQDRCGGAS